MTLSYLRNILVLLDLFALFVQCEYLNVSGSAITTRFWDCCKPSCSWNGKAAFSQPVQSCSANDQPLSDFNIGTGCGTGGSAYTCSDQQAWAVNDTFSYGYAGIFLTGHPNTEAFWCCSCFQLNFTSGPVKGKTMLIQASNTAFDINTANRFSLAIPGGNTTSHDACAKEYGVDPTVFGQTNSGVSSIDDCNNLPQPMQAGCRWRFDWFKDAQDPNVEFKRVPCPSILTNRTGCVRDDEQDLIEGKPSGSTVSSPTSPLLAIAAILGTAFLLV